MSLFLFSPVYFLALLFAGYPLFSILCFWRCCVWIARVKVWLLHFVHWPLLPFVSACLVRNWLCAFLAIFAHTFDLLHHAFRSISSMQDYGMHSWQGALPPCLIQKYQGCVLKSRIWGYVVQQSFSWTLYLVSENWYCHYFCLCSSVILICIR